MAGGGYDGAVIGVGCAFYLADGFYLIVIGVAGVGLVVGVIKICGGAEEGIGAVFGAAAVYLIFDCPFYGRPLEVGLAGGGDVLRLGGDRRQGVLIIVVHFGLVEGLVYTGIFIHEGPLRFRACVIHVRQMIAAIKRAGCDELQAGREQDGGHAGTAYGIQTQRLYSLGDDYAACPAAGILDQLFHILGIQGPILGGVVSVSGGHCDLLQAGAGAGGIHPDFRHAGGDAEGLETGAAGESFRVDALQTCGKDDLFQAGAA